MVDRRASEPPRLGHILATDGNVAFLAGCGLGFAAWVALILAIARPASVWWHLLAVSTPLLVLWPPALLWAAAIRSTFRHGVEAPGRVISRRTGLRGLVVVRFRYRLDGRERTAANQPMPRSKVGPLRPDAAVTVRIAETCFPGPLIQDVYLE